MEFDNFANFLSPEQARESKAFWERELGPELPILTVIILTFLKADEDKVEALVEQIKALALTFPSATSEHIAYFMLYILFTFCLLNKEVSLETALGWIKEAQKDFPPGVKNVH